MSPNLLHMRKDKGPTPFGRYLLDLMQRLGIETPTELAERSGIDPSNVSRWINKGITPTPAKLREMADHLGPNLYDELMIAAGHLPPSDTEPTHMHRLAHELDAMLGQHSNLSNVDRDLLEKLVDKVMGGFR